jgi:uncharacterized protein with HEPN domain
MLNAIAGIQQGTRGKSFDDFSNDPLLVAAVCYLLIIIGESAVTMPAEVQQQAPGIPWGQIRGMRNRLIHEHFQVSRTLVWSTVAQNLAPLADQLRQLLPNGQPAPGG